jgi:uncharacterized protein (UPF0332 family)
LAILTTEHLFAQADGLLSLFPKRRPRQTELRRAVSAAYYGLYHFILKQAADEYIGGRHGKTFPPSKRYVLAYRSVSHTTLYSLCAEIKKPRLPEKLQPFAAGGQFSSDLRRFSTLFVDLQERRHTADYDISIMINRADAVLAIALARTAVERYPTIARSGRQIFLALLLFPARGKL